MERRSQHSGSTHLCLWGIGSSSCLLIVNPLHLLAHYCSVSLNTPFPSYLITGTPWGKRTTLHIQLPYGPQLSVSSAALHSNCSGLLRIRESLDASWQVQQNLDGVPPYHQKTLLCSVNVLTGVLAQSRLCKRNCDGLQKCLPFPFPTDKSNLTTSGIACLYRQLQAQDPNRHLSLRNRVPWSMRMAPWSSENRRSVRQTLQLAPFGGLHEMPILETEIG